MYAIFLVANAALESLFTQVVKDRFVRIIKQDKFVIDRQNVYSFN